MESFIACVDNLTNELKRIKEIDCDDDTKGDKMKRKIEAWFKGYGRFRKF